MEKSKYTEQDIQDYATGIFVGNESNFEEYLKQNPFVMAQLKAYENLNQLLQSQEAPSLPFNLADKVVAAIEEKKYVKEGRQLTVLHYFLMLIGIAILIIIFNYFNWQPFFSSFLDKGMLWGSGLLLLVFIAAFNFVEIKQVQKKFGLYNN